LILERATGKSVTEYLNEKIWTHLGTEYDASWSIDRNKNGLEKTFCCINARARDFAKFGRLYLNKGNWQGTQLIPENWVIESTTPTREEGGAARYKYQWWLTQLGYEANGLHGQFIYVCPQKNVVLVRLGKRDGDIQWGAFFDQVAALL
jgi:CubicO group peptidase (beta-lactamase class C family)